MSNKIKSKNLNKAKESQYNKTKKEPSRIEKAMNKMENHLNNISDHNKYKERIKTSYISMLLYFILIGIYQNYQGKPTFSISLIISGILICIYNIIKSVLSIRDKQKVKHNKILIFLQSLFILFFISLFFYGSMPL